MAFRGSHGAEHLDDPNYNENDGCQSPKGIVPVVKILIDERESSD
jgi:hypothetical protein